ncbi:hypothetical protein F5Y12DRAFT_157933 [Xylaria sp. FL1777]|nr:hypothetical protein F5Y12DRAFT_157933 [Xylaria sp. FL1777]
MTTERVSGQDGPEDIPPLSTIAPSIYVPTDRDFTKTPPPLSDDPKVRLETMIDELDWHAARVEKNMVLMLAREAERVRRVGQAERIQQQTHGRPAKDQQWRTDNELLLEEMILREDEDAVSRILGPDRYRDNEDAGRSYHQHYSSASHPRPPHPEYADLSTLRREKMFRLEVDENRQTPGSVPLTHVLNLVKWGWDDQVDGHRLVVQKEKDERRAILERQMQENPMLVAGTTPAASASPPPASLAHRRRGENSIDGDVMDIDR